MQADFEFAWEGASAPNGAWSHLQVVKFQGVEELSDGFRYELVVVAKPPVSELDPDELVMARGSLRWKTLTAPMVRVVHGIVTSAEELDPVPDGTLYRLVFEPPSLRMAHRRRCRIFLDKTLRQIVDEVLSGEPYLSKIDGGMVPPDNGSPDWVPFRENYTWRIADASRLDDPKVRAYVVQYNESDLDFVKRLLEEEGISYHYEHGEVTCLLVLADADAGRARAEPFLPFGYGIPGREISSVKLGGRLRPVKVTLDDYNWKNPPLAMVAESELPSGSPAQASLTEYHWPGGYGDESGQGKGLARAVAERYATESRFATGQGSARLLQAGSVFLLEHSKAKYEGEYLVSRIEIRAEQAGVLSVQQGGSIVPYACRFELARRGTLGQSTESRFRPARKTHKPRIAGTQTAFVTAEPMAPMAEIHVGGPPQGEIGCVRLKFHWDTDAKRLAKEPSSTWVRVSQMFAGGNEGAVWHPRVGVEVVVDFEDGDPDRPMVVGRVYNGQKLPPAPSVGSPTISTWKSFSSPGGGNYNELLFDDATGSERIRMHAARDWLSEVLHDRSETVANDSSSSVGNNRTEQTTVNRNTTVGADNSEVVGSNESVSIAANQSISVGVNQSLMVGAAQSETVGASQTSTVGAARTASVGAADTLTVAAFQTITVGAAQTTSVGGAQTISVGGAQTTSVGAAQTMNVGSTTSMNAGTSQTFNSVAQTFNAGAAFLVNAGATFTVNTPTATVNASSVARIVSGGSSVEVTGGAITITSGNVTIKDGNINVTGGKVDVASQSTVRVTGAGNVDVKGAIVKLN